jgi:thiamine-phosphate pyrophosphorylase
MGLGAKLRLARTLVIVDARHEDFPTFVSALFHAGADIIQVRDPEASLATVGTAVVAAQQIAMPRNKLVAVTGDLVLAKAVMADVLVGGPTLDPGLAHARMHEYALVGAPVFDGASCYSVASDHNVNFALVGPVYLPHGSPVAAPGLDLVRAAVGAMPAGDASGTPWFAIGGLTPDRIDEVIAAGARRAGIVVSGEAGLAAVTAISTALREAWDADPDLHDFAFRVLTAESPAGRVRSFSEPIGW